MQALRELALFGDHDIFDEMQKLLSQLKINLTQLE